MLLRHNANLIKKMRAQRKTRGGLTLVENLYTPEKFDEKGHYKAIIVEGSFTSVKEQMPATHARKFADNGFVLLAFDYSSYGES
jgi:fermentation-respiration switch protein FrsA (DUF1100 family)